MSISSADMAKKNREDIVSLPNDHGDVQYNVEEAVDWLTCVAIFLGKPRLKGAAKKIVKALHSAGFDSWAGLAKMSAADYVSAGGMIAGDAAAVHMLLHEDDTVSATTSLGSAASATMSSTEIGEFVVKSSAESATRAFKAMQATRNLPEGPSELVKFKVSKFKDYIRALSRYYKPINPEYARLVRKVIDVLDYPRNIMNNKVLTCANLTGRELELDAFDNEVYSDLQDTMHSRVWDALCAEDQSSAIEVLLDMAVKITCRPLTITGARVHEIMTDTNVVQSAAGLSPIMEGFIDRVEEFRYSQHCSYETIAEAMCDKLVRFQPMMIKLSAHFAKRRVCDDEIEQVKHDSKQYDTMITLLWELVDVAEYKNSVSKPSRVGRKGGTKDGGYSSDSTSSSGTSNKAPNSKPKGKNDGLCWKFQKGECKYGDKCKFKHEKPVNQIQMAASALIRQQCFQAAEV